MGKKESVTKSELNKAQVRFRLGSKGKESSHIVLEACEEREGGGQLNVQHCAVAPPHVCELGLGAGVDVVLL